MNNKIDPKTEVTEATNTEISIDIDAAIDIDMGDKTECSVLQFFVESDVDAPDAIDILDSVYEPYKNVMSWARGYKRIMVNLPKGSFDMETAAITQIKTYTSVFGAFMYEANSFMFTNNKARREFYMYYSNEDHNKIVRHDFNFCDNGYNCFEINYSHVDDKWLLRHLANFMAVITSAECLDAKNNGYAMCSGGEYKLLAYKKVIKIKLMPDFNLDDEFFDKMFDSKLMSILRISKKTR